MSTELSAGSITNYKYGPGKKLQGAECGKVLGGDVAIGPAVKHGYRVDVRAGVVVVTFLEKSLSDRLDGGPVITGQGEQIELEEDLHLLQSVIILRRHVNIPLRMGQDREITYRLHLLENTMETIRRSEIRGLHKKMVSPRAHRQEVILFQAFLEQIINHVLRPEMELDGTAVGRAQSLVPYPKVRRSVWNVLHDVGSQPD